MGWLCLNQSVEPPALCCMPPAQVEAEKEVVSRHEVGHALVASAISQVRTEVPAGIAVHSCPWKRQRMARAWRQPCACSYKGGMIPLKSVKAEEQRNVVQVEFLKVVKGTGGLEESMKYMYAWIRGNLLIGHKAPLTQPCPFGFGALPFAVLDGACARVRTCRCMCMCVRVFACACVCTCVCVCACPLMPQARCQLRVWALLLSCSRIAAAPQQPPASNQAPLLAAGSFASAFHCTVCSFASTFHPTAWSGC